MITKQEWKIGDCLELMKNVRNNSIDLIVTDPPYNLEKSGKVNLTNGGKLTELNYNFKFFDINSIGSMVQKLTKNGSVVLFFDNKMITNVWNTMEKGGII